MFRATTFALLVAVCAPSMLLTGCAGKDSTQLETRAHERLNRNDLDGARSDLEQAIRKAQEEGKPADGLRQQLADVNARIERRRITSEDNARAEALRHLQAAKTAADARQWKMLLSELHAAERLQGAANDPALSAEISKMVASQPMTLLRARQAYRDLCSRANWSTGFAIFDMPGTFWLELNSYVKADDRLARACALTGDAELTRLGADVAEQWRQYMASKKVADATDNDDSTIGVLINVGSRISQVKNAFDYAGAQRKFEVRMEVLLNGSQLPAVSYGPVRRDQPAPVAAAPAAPAPVAAAPAAPAAPAATSTTRSEQIATRAAPTTPAAPAATPPQTDRSQPNFDDLR